MADGTTQDVRIGIGVDTTDIVSAIADVDKLDQHIEKLGKAKADPASLVQMEAVLQALGATSKKVAGELIKLVPDDPKAKEYERQLENITAKMEKLNNIAKNTKESLKNQSLPVQPPMNRLQNLNNRWETADNNFQQNYGRVAAASNTTGNVLIGSGVAAGAGMLAMAKSGTDAYLQFGDGMAKIRAVVDGTEADFKRLEDAALSLDTALTLGMGPAKQQAAMVELGKAGLSSSQMIDGALVGALTLAAAGEIEVGEATKVGVNAMAQFNKTAADFPHIADVITAGANKSVASVHDMSLAMSMVGNVAGQLMKTSLEETTGVLAAFHQAGLRGSDAGTSLKQMMLNLQPVSDKQTKLMERLNMSFVNSDGSMKNLSQVAEELKTKLGGLSDSQRLATMTTLFGSDAIRSAGILYDLGAEGVDKWATAVNDSGSAMRTAITKMDSDLGTIEKAKAAFESLKVSFGKDLFDELRPMMKEGMDELKRMAESGELTEITKNAAVMVKGVVTVINGLGSAVGKILSWYRSLSPYQQAMVNHFVAITPQVLILSGAFLKLLPAIAFFKELKAVNMASSIAELAKVGTAAEVAGSKVTMLSGKLSGLRKFNGMKLLITVAIAYEVANSIATAIQSDIINEYKRGDKSEAGAQKLLEQGRKRVNYNANLKKVNRKKMNEWVNTQYPPSVEMVPVYDNPFKQEPLNFKKPLDLTNNPLNFGNNELFKKPAPVRYEKRVTPISPALKINAQLEYMRKFYGIAPNQIDIDAAKNKPGDDNNGGTVTAGESKAEKVKRYEQLLKRLQEESARSLSALYRLQGEHDNAVKWRSELSAFNVRKANMEIAFAYMSEEQKARALAQLDEEKAKLDYNLGIEKLSYEQKQKNNDADDERKKKLAEINDAENKFNQKQKDNLKAIVESEYQNRLKGINELTQTQKDELLAAYNDAKVEINVKLKTANLDQWKNSIIEAGNSIWSKNAWSTKSLEAGMNLGGQKSLKELYASLGMKDFSELNSMMQLAKSITQKTSPTLPIGMTASMNMDLLNPSISVAGISQNIAAGGVNAPSTKGKEAMNITIVMNGDIAPLAEMITNISSEQANVTLQNANKNARMGVSTMFPSPKLRG
jgi:TP901 family phage tail tape measure protein